MCVYVFFSVYLNSWFASFAKCSYKKNLLLLLFKTIFLYKILRLRIEFRCTHYYCFVGSMKIVAIFKYLIANCKRTGKKHYVEIFLSGFRKLSSTCQARASNIICPWNISSRSQYSELGTSSVQLKYFARAVLSIPHSSMSKTCL